MDAIVYAHSAKQEQRIKKFINDPDSTSGVVTVPKVIASGESVTIPVGRVAVLPNVQIDGTLTVNGDVFIPSGATFGDLESQIASKVSTSAIETAMAPYNKGFKNYIINGNFDVWQYKDAGLTYPQTSSGYGSDDRWSNVNLGSTKTHSQVACTDTERALFNASFFSRTVVTSVAGAYNYCNKAQLIENVTRLAGKTVTLSFWAKADSAKNIGFILEQGFGTGGSPSALALSNSQSIALTTTWQKKTITFTVPSIVGKTIGTDGYHTSYTAIYFAFDYGSSITIYPAQAQQSGTFDIAQVQLEEGSVATPFEDRSQALELTLCQRYFEISHLYIIGNTVTNGYVGGTVSFNTRKRVIPTISVYNVFENSGNNNGFQISSACESSFRVYTNNTTNNTQVVMSAKYYAAAEIA